MAKCFETLGIPNLFWHSDLYNFVGVMELLEPQYNCLEYGYFPLDTIDDEVQVISQLVL